MNFFRRMYRNGLGESEDAISELRVSLSNLIILFSVPFVASHLPFFYEKGHYVPLIINLILCLLLILAYFLNYKRKKSIATKIVFTACSLLIFMPVINYGRNTDLQALFPVMMIFIFVLFDKTVDLIIFSVWLIIVFLSCYIFLEFNKPIIDNRVLEYDYYLNMSFAIFACGILAHIVMKTLNEYNREKDEAYQKLAEQNRIINKQNEEMELFTMMASHDLKTPTRTMLSFLGLLNKSGEITSPSSQEYLDMALLGARQLNNLISGISDFKNSTADKTNITYQPTNDILDQVIKTMDALNSKSISINAKELHNLKVSNTDLYHIFQNLIENAIKYNKSDKKELNITSKLSETDILFTFSDNGIGIESEYLDYIFDPFKKIHSAGEYESSGLGLAICKRVISSYDGTIKAQSEGLGKGTTIVIRFPIALKMD